MSAARSTAGGTREPVDWMTNGEKNPGLVAMTGTGRSTPPRESPRPEPAGC